jgi:hypothetical protein
MLQSRFVAGSVYHRLKLPASATSALCPGPDILLRGEGAGDPALLLGIGGGVGGLMAPGGGRLGVKSVIDDGRDNVSVASSNRGAVTTGVSVQEDQLLQKLHANVLLQQQRPPAALQREAVAADDLKNAGGSDAQISSIPPATGHAVASSKVVSWLQASEAAFAEERAMFMQNTAVAPAAHSAVDDDDGPNRTAPETSVKQPVLRRNAGNGSSNNNNSVPTMSACRIDFERIEMAGGGSLTQPVLLAALRASGTGSMKQVNPSTRTPQSRGFEAIRSTISNVFCSC